MTVAEQSTELAVAERLVGKSLNRVERAMFEAMWSEHCAYKHSRTLLATLPTTGERVLVGPGENAGALDIGDGLAVVFKVESHNHPSAVEPYQGAATGVGGIVRDIFTMAARPIALLNGLRFGPLDPADDPSGQTDAPTAARNRWLFDGVVGGIAGYGNCLGIPDVGGELAFDPSYSGNPLVNAMCVGLARRDDLVLARAAEPGSTVLLVGSATGRDGIQGASFASGVLGADASADRPAVQVGNPFLEKLLLEACLAVAGHPAVVAMQDLGAAGLTCALAEVTARGGVGAEVDLDRVPLREAGMDAHDILLSESQERMLLIVRPGGEDAVAEVFARYDLHATAIGRVIAEPVMRCTAGGQLACELPPLALTDLAPRYDPLGAPPAGLDDLRALDLGALAARIPDGADLLRLLDSPNLRSRRPVWQRYDHMNGARTVIGPGADAALLRIEGGSKGIALSLDGPGRQAALDPWVAAAAAVVEGALNVAVTGAVPIGITNCLNLGSPEQPAGAWQLQQTVAGLGAACRELGLPIVSGNVSLYNESGGRPIIPAAVIGTVGLIEDRSRRIGPAWQAGDAVWLLGAPGAVPGAVAGSEFAYFAGEPGGQPSIDLSAAGRLIDLLPRLATAGFLSAAHDVSRGGLAAAVARMALAAGVGARLDLPASAWPSAAAFGEASGRVVVSCHPTAAVDLERASFAGGVPLLRLGEVGGDALRLGPIALGLAELAVAWQTGF